MHFVQEVILPGQQPSAFRRRNIEESTNNRKKTCGFPLLMPCQRQLLVGFGKKDCVDYVRRMFCRRRPVPSRAVTHGRSFCSSELTHHLNDDYFAHFLSSIVVLRAHTHTRTHTRTHTHTHTHTHTYTKCRLIVLAPLILRLS